MPSLRRAPDAIPTLQLERFAIGRTARVWSGATRPGKLPKSCKTEGARARALAHRTPSNMDARHRNRPAHSNGIVALLLLTGQRRDEVADAEWAEFDFENSLWTIPSHRTKNGRTHLVPLSAKASELLLALPSRGQRFVFPGEGNKRATFSGWSRSKARLDRQTGVIGWTLHDLRRTVATCLAERSVQPHVVERLLNHSTGIVSGVCAVYNRATYVQEVRLALEQWSQHLAQLVTNGTQSC